jgi:hypothetical protein
MSSDKTASSQPTSGVQKETALMSSMVDVEALIAWFLTSLYEFILTLNDSISSSCDIRIGRSDGASVQQQEVGISTNRDHQSLLLCEQEKEEEDTSPRVSYKRKSGLFNVSRGSSIDEELSI